MRNPFKRLFDLGTSEPHHRAPAPHEEAVRPHDHTSEVHVSEELKNAERLDRLGTEEDKPYYDKYGE